MPLKDKKGKKVMLDALFVIGLTREVSDSVRDAIDKINGRDACIISIDVPSGKRLSLLAGQMKGDVMLMYFGTSWASTGSDVCAAFKIGNSPSRSFAKI